MQTHPDYHLLAGRYLTTLTGCFDGLLVVSPDGYILEVNEIYEKISGFPRSLLVGAHISSLEAQKGNSSRLFLSKTTSHGARFSLMLNHVSGNPINVDVGISIDPQTDCKLFFVKPAEGKTSHEGGAELAEAIITLAPVGILVHEASGRCIRANLAAAQLMGAPLSEIQKHDYLKSQSWKNYGMTAFAKNVLDSGNTKTFTNSFETVYGKHLDLSITMCRIEANQQLFLGTVFTDIADIVQTKEALIEARDIAVTTLKRALAAEQKLTHIAEESQKIIGEELHDDLGQHLTAVAFMSERLAYELRGSNMSHAAEANKITQLVQNAIEKTRRLAHDLYPQELKDENLQALLAGLLRQAETSFNIRTQFIYSGTGMLSQQIVIDLYRIVQEAIHNAVRHGRATEVTVKASLQGRNIALEIADNGTGLTNTGPRTKEAGIGTRTMAYRAIRLGGTLEFSSGASGGTRILVEIPSALEE